MGKSKTAPKRRFRTVYALSLNPADNIAWYEVEWWKLDAGNIHLLIGGQAHVIKLPGKYVGVYERASI